MKINDGLILPFRFYDSLDKQMRYRGCGRYEQEDIRHNEYLIAYGCRLLPFQIIRATDPSTTTNLWLINASTDVSVDLTSDLTAADWSIETIGDYDYITYFANNDILNGGNCVLDDCVYYLKFGDGTYYWYSELFKVIDSGEDIDPNYRIWSTTTGCFRIWEDNDDLRITKE